MEILIIDDDKKFSYILKGDLHNHFKEKQDKAHITIINDHFNDVNYFNKYHIVFLDIDLVTDNGLEIAKQLRETDNNVIIVFISSKNTLVFKTFVVKPFFFIRKSDYKMDIIYFFEILNKYFKKNTFISLDSRATQVHIPIDSIIFVESHEHQLTIHSKKEVYYDSSSLSGFLQKLPDNNFLQIHKSYIINFDYLKGIEKGEILLMDGMKLPIGRKYKNIFFEKYQEYLIK